MVKRTKERVYLGKGFFRDLIIRDDKHYPIKIENRKRFWCCCLRKCVCKPWTFIAER